LPHQRPGDDHARVQRNAAKLTSEDAMARKREDTDPNDSTDVSLPPEVKRAQIDQMLQRAVPKTPEWLKKNGAESRGADFAHYAGAHEPKASDDTVEHEPAVVLDETKRDVLNLSPEEIERIRMRREIEAKRNESTFSASLPKKSRVGLIVLGAVITIVVIALLVHMTGGPSTVSTTATSATIPAAGASIEVPPVPTIAETAATAGMSSASVASAAAPNVPATTSATPTRPIRSAASHSTSAPSATPTTSASSSGVFFPHI
jgi:hypothetical protein